MGIYIRYTDGYRESPGAIERIDTPLAGGMCRVSCAFSHAGGSPGTWALVVSCVDRTEEAGEGVVRRMETEWAPLILLPHECADREEYEEWLSENVESIDFDGRTFWERPNPDIELDDSALDADFI